MQNEDSSVKSSLNYNLQQTINKAREYAQANPGKILGGLSALIIGAGLLRKRRS